MYFKSMSDLNNSLQLQELSMGMSSDYQEAVKLGSTFVRIGSSILDQETSEFLLRFFYLSILIIL